MSERKTILVAFLHQAKAINISNLHRYVTHRSTGQTANHNTLVINDAQRDNAQYTTTLSPTFIQTCQAATHTLDRNIVD